MAIAIEIKRIKINNLGYASTIFTIILVGTLAPAGQSRSQKQ
jgi:hypothetical protein